MTLEEGKEGFVLALANVGLSQDGAGQLGTTFEKGIPFVETAIVIAGKSRLFGGRKSMLT